jgi:tRNA (guanine37-N1)-methyltransferase
MRIDAISIFPEYFASLEISLIGKAIRSGIIDFTPHDLRNFTTDKHRTVDDSPFGGGPGMVMRPEPWGQAIDSIFDSETDPILIFLTPAGARLNQQMVRELAAEKHIGFMCGRYEGIDQRVLDYAAQRHRVVELSIGDYVLNGGELAALVVIEAVARLLPGVVGNEESLVSESHEDGLLDYPVYTKPQQWRGFAVPEILLSGNHAAIAQWRSLQRIERTAKNQQDLDS